MGLGHLSRRIVWHESASLALGRPQRTISQMQAA